MKYIPILGILIFIVILAVLLLRALTPEDAFITSSTGKIVKHGNPSLEAARNLAIGQAKELFLVKQEEGTDLSKGPCLENEIIPDWAFDIAHNPRTLIDDDPVNQCSSFLDGKTHHFVELDTNGNLIRAL